MCQAHYGRMRAAGDPHEVALAYPAVSGYVRNKTNLCKSLGCADESKKRGMCDRHYSQWRYANVLSPGAGTNSNRVPSEFVYLLGAPGWAPAGVLKVGRGTPGRLKDLQTILPTAEFLREVPVDEPNRVEKLLHHILRCRHVAGEWFTVTPEEFDAALAQARLDLGMFRGGRRIDREIQFQKYGGSSLFCD